MTTQDIESIAQAMRDFAQIVGLDNALLGNSPATEYARDQYHPYYDTDKEPLPAGVVRPGDLDELRKVVALANERGVSLWTSSRGRNYGYGGPAAVEGGSIALDLRRMDRILEINEEHAYAVVEPGVSSEMLMAEIERRGLAFWPDGAVSPYGSILATALERGVGYSLNGERFEALCGLEVLLPTGELIRTGTGSFPGVTTWHHSKYGFGPSLDGLFSQSNFGIVTKAGVWLMRQPESFRHAEVYISDLSEAGEFMQILSELRKDGTVENAINGAPNYGGHIDGGFGIGGGRPRIGSEVPGMRARLAYHGMRAVNEAKWERTLERLSTLSSFSFNTAAYDAPYDYSGWGSEARLAAGIPSNLAMPTWDGVHYMAFGSFIVPNTGAAFTELIEMTKAVYAEFGREFFAPTWHMPSPRTLLCLVHAQLKGDIAAPDRAANVDNEESVRLVRRLIEEALKHGWVEYRAGTLFMDQVASLQTVEESSMRQITEKLKDVFDPNGILNPGKSGIWGAGNRAERGEK